MRKLTAFNGWRPLGMSLVTAGCAAAMGCATRPAASTAPAGQAVRAAAERPVIVRLVGRNYSVVISAGLKGPVYTVRKPDGQLLAENLTLDELRQSHTDLYDKLAPAISPESSASTVMADK